MQAVSVVCGQGRFNDHLDMHARPYSSQGQLFVMNLPSEYVTPVTAVIVQLWKM